jgi:hypothetical protein
MRRLIIFCFDRSEETHPMPEGTAPEKKRTCFVVMGFGEKVDFQTGRKLNLDAVYRGIIKPAAEEAGLECYRADEIVHSGVIDVPMYQQILTADVVVADLSTSNSNAFYELGVRHALRPFTTIIIAEDQFKFPFDLGHIVIRQYEHLGKDIGLTEAIRFRQVLKEAIQTILDNPTDDSPVYAFLKGLKPPTFPDLGGEEAEASMASVPPPPGTQTHRALMEQAQAAITSAAQEMMDRAKQEGDFLRAKDILSEIREKMKPKDSSRPEDPYIIQQLALVTYKSKQPTAQAALEEARALLLTLNPKTSNDTETLGLWGAVHKRLWDITEDTKYLDEAVRSYTRGFYLGDDYYNGINLAFLLNVRASASCKRADRAPSVDEATSGRAEAIYCFVRAVRVRREVITICEALLGTGKLPDEEKYWVLATMAEAYLGVGEEAAAQQKLQEAFALTSAQWMKDTTQEQMAKLRRLLVASPLKYIKTDV